MPETLVSTGRICTVMNFIPTQNERSPALITNHHGPVDLDVTITTESTIFDGVGRELMQRHPYLSRKVRAHDDALPLHSDTSGHIERGSMSIDQLMQRDTIALENQVLGAPI